MTTLAPPPLTAGPPRRLWLITFVDLVMLLLAFFVLLFSMSRIDTERYGAVARSYAAAFSSLGGTQDVDAGPQHIPAERRTPGDDLAYLETVLRTAFARDPDLAHIQFRLTGQYLILELPAATGDDEASALDAAMQQQVFEIGGVLSNLPNRISVVVPAGAGANAWTHARRQAATVRKALMKAGYPKPLAALVQGGEPGQVAPVQIFIMPETETAS